MSGGGAKWDGFSHCCLSRRPCCQLEPRRLRPGSVGPPVSAPAVGGAAIRSSMQSCGRCAAASAAARCRYARCCGAGQAADEPSLTIDDATEKKTPGFRPGFSFRDGTLDLRLDTDERLRRVDVGERGLAVDRYLDDGLAI